MPAIDRSVIVLGAGASRGASYAHPSEFPSPLDFDFFDLLQRLEPGKDSAAIDQVLAWRKSLSYDHRRSMERAFFTLQTRAYLSEKFTSKDATHPNDDEVVAGFATCVNALLRKAHGTNRCDYHERLFESLGRNDTIITFNYDLVAERALKPRAQSISVLGRWLYGLDLHSSASNIPVLLKLHGSSNWSLRKKKIEVRTKDWGELDSQPGYRGNIGTGTVFRIFLPFWDKRIEKEPWLPLWKLAYERLQLLENLIVWGYSLPTTDIKTQELFKLAVPDRRFHLCVIDPSLESRQRWRDLFPEAQYWEYANIQEFLKYRPSWWT